MLAAFGTKIGALMACAERVPVVVVLSEGGLGGRLRNAEGEGSDGDLTR